MWEMMRAGLGIGVLPDNLWPRTERVEPVFLDVPEITFPVWLATHRELRTSRRIRIVFDALAEALRSPSAHSAPL
ncbi:MAG: DNA-binding transcriptional LysR family regulator [Yoonia sp.]|jgi:DNA-binding transcriptional LysR family regulator